MSATPDAAGTPSYPERNPFSYQASVTVDSPSSLGTAEALPSPTLLWQPVTSLRKLTQRYLDSYRPSLRGTGFPVALVGGHGTGKTHTIRYIIGQVESGDLSNPAVSSCHQIYARSENSDLMQLYRQLMRQVPLTVLRDMTLRFLGAISSEMFGAVVGDEEQKERATQLVQENPEMLRDVFARHIVLEDEARAKQIEEVEKTIAKEENFHNVLPYLLRDDLADTARHWLVGDTLTAEELAMLGVSANITTPALARWGLRFLATLFGRGGRPLIVYIDQYEKLVLGIEREKENEKTMLLPDNIGVLRAIADELSKESAMVVLVGNADAWKALSAVPDLRQRFGNNVIEFPLLTLDEARDLVALYLTLGRYEVLDLWPLETPDHTAITLRGHAMPIRAITAINAGAQLVSASKDSTIKVWDAKAGLLRKTLVGHSQGVNSVAASRDGRILVSAADDREVRVWNLADDTWRLVGRHDSWVNDVALSPDDRYVVSAGSDAAIRIWDLHAPAAAPRPPLEAHTDTVWSVAISPDGKIMASGSSDCTVRLWTFPDGEPIARKQGHRSWVNSLAISPSGNVLASASDDGTVRLWRMEDGSQIRVLAPPLDPSGRDPSPVRGLSWLDDRQLLSASIDGTYRTWRISDGNCIAQAQRPRSAINPMAFSVLRGDAFTVVSSASERNQSAESSVTTGAKAATSELYPFMEDAIRTILAIGGGNVRRLVQDCAESFQFAALKRIAITEAIVREALSSKSAERIDRDIALRKVEQLIAARSMTFRRDHPIGKATADVAVLVGGQPRLLVQVTKPMFSANEVQEALKNVNLISEARDVPAEIILVVVGYVSPAVTDLLAKASRRLLVFDPDTFDTQFAAVLDQVPAELPLPTQLDLNAIKEQILTSITGALTQLPAIRSAEAGNVSTMIRQTLAGDSEGEYDRLRAAWRKERKALEERIKEVRKKARDDEFGELEKLHAKSASSSAGRVAAAVAGLAFLLYAAMISSDRIAPEGANLLVGWVYDSNYRRVWWYVFLSLGLTFVAWSITGSFELWQWFLRSIVGPVTSVEELDRLAHRYGWIPAMLVARSQNPHLRYVAALEADQKMSLRRMVRAINGEPSRVVRRAYALAIGKRLQPPFINEVIADISAKRTPEIGYAVEIAARQGYFAEDTTERLPGPLRALALITTNAPKGIAKSSYFGGLHYVLSDDDAGSPPPTLAAAAIREALRDLSPFEEPGIGRLNELESIEKVDECYLFFAEQQFFLEQTAM